MMAPTEVADTVERILRWAKMILSIVGIVGGWALALTVWLVAMHGDVNQLKRDHEDIHKEITRIDERGTRALETIRNRQDDVITNNKAQDIKIDQNAARLNDVYNKQVENRYLLEQAVDTLRRAGLLGIMPRERYNQPEQNQR
jgi:hypothetical protein